MNEFEKLLRSAEFFEKEEKEFEQAIEKKSKNSGASELMKANGNASLLEFLEMVSLIITNTMDDMHVECMPDEKAYIIKDDPVEAINHPIVTFKVNDRRHKENFGYKPKLIETVQNIDATGKTAFIYSERYVSRVQFNIMASEYRHAWEIMERIEDVLLSYAETIKGNGIVEYYFNKLREELQNDSWKRRWFHKLSQILPPKLTKKITSVFLKSMR